MGARTGTRDMDGRREGTRCWFKDPERNVLSVSHAWLVDNERTLPALWKGAKSALEERGCASREDGLAEDALVGFKRRTLVAPGGTQAPCTG